MRNIICLAAALFAATPLFAEATVTTIATDIEASGGVAVGPDGNVYVADFGVTLQQAGGANIYRIAPDGSSIEILNAEFGGASGNAFGSDGDLYQSDVARGEAWRVAMDGSRTQIASGMQSPVGIAPQADGSVYVTNCGAHAILRFDPDGTTETIAQGAPLVCPNGLATGGDGNLYAVNFGNDAMVRIALPSGEMTVFANIPSGGNGHISWANERFYLTSYRAGKVYSVTLDREICLIAGSGERANEDGDALTASFFRPNGAAVSADGDTLYTNTTLTIVEPQDPQLHPNAVRRVDGLLSMLECPDDRVIAD